MPITNLTSIISCIPFTAICRHDFQFSLKVKQNTTKYTRDVSFFIYYSFQYLPIYGTCLPLQSYSSFSFSFFFENRGGVSLSPSFSLSSLLPTTFSFLSSPLFFFSVPLFSLSLQVSLTTALASFDFFPTKSNSCLSLSLSFFSPLL